MIPETERAIELLMLLIMIAGALVAIYVVFTQ
jgi:hypothetical protein